MENKKPDREALEIYAKHFSESQTLKWFCSYLEFPDEDTIRAVIDPVTEPMRGGLGSDAVNGGVIAALCDLIIGASPALVDPTRRSATIHLSINYERPLIGSVVIAEGKIDRAGRSIVFSSGVVMDQDRTICARAQGVVRLSDKTWDSGVSPAIN